MKVYQTNEIKNIALIGSAGSGKTTLAESMLFEAGIIKRRGSVEQKNTVSDYFPVEQEYGYSVFSTVFHVEWNNKKEAQYHRLPRIRRLRRWFNHRYERYRSGCYPHQRPVWS